MSSNSPAIDRWWPTTQSFDLVEGPLRDVARALETTVRSFLMKHELVTSHRKFATLDDAFGAAPEFGNVPTYYLALPTRSRWTVLWNNSFLCSGYDSLAWNLTRSHGFTTVHFEAHDDETTFQPGALFNHRSGLGEAMIERHVYAGSEDRRWIFFAKGPPLPEEDVAGYEERIKRKRFNEAKLATLLEKLDARPWDERFYDLDSPCFVMDRLDAPPTVIRRTREQVLRPRSG